MSQLFSEIYNCYFQVVKSIIEKNDSISKNVIIENINNMGFEESIITLMPKLLNDDWGFLESDDENLVSVFSKDFITPLSNHQKAFIKTILLDEKMKLFLSDEQIDAINSSLIDIEPFYTPDVFFYYDRYADKDDYGNPEYRKHFQLIISAIKERRYLNIEYRSPINNISKHLCIPCRLEYSVKNDRFRLLVIKNIENEKPTILQLNINRIVDIIPTEVIADDIPDLNIALRKSYFKEPVKILIYNKKNALERAMLQFANYDKETRKIDNNTYECLIYYNKAMETELLIEILSFGPMIKVIGNESFLKQLKQRLDKQAKLLSPTAI